jgi:hypothetical protein
VGYTNIRRYGVKGVAGCIVVVGEALSLWFDKKFGAEFLLK